MNILIVDDEKFNLRMAEELIKETIDDSSVFVCNLPETVLVQIEEHKIDIILLDIIMPNVSGIDVLKAIRKRKQYKDIQIIMFTGIKDKENLKLCFENGANDYINKPIDFVEFAARMKASVKARKNIVSLLEMANTITEQYQDLHNMTQELKNTQFNLIQKEKLASLGEIAAGIAHEINNPMGFISSNFEIMKQYMKKINTVMVFYKKFVQHLTEDKLIDGKVLQEKILIHDMEQKYNMDFILADFETMLIESIDGANRISKIVQNMQALAKTGTEHEWVYNDLNQIIEEGLLIVKHELKDVAEIDKQTTDGELNLLCNKGEVGQVILNVLLNAIYAIKSLTLKSLGKITIKTCAEGSYAVCQITDNGSGIKEEYLHRIFDPFFTTKDVGAGVGLGLSVAYDIVVKKHGGDFQVDSKVNQGSTFTIKLPMRGSI
jgi:Signal transduction histidine kinase regulating C4-dicarboxylate transport system